MGSGNGGQSEKNFWNGWTKSHLGKSGQKWQSRIIQATNEVGGHKKQKNSANDDVPGIVQGASLRLELHHCHFKRSLQWGVCVHLLFQDHLLRLWHWTASERLGNCLPVPAGLYRAACPRSGDDRPHGQRLHVFLQGSSHLQNSPFLVLAFL